MLWKDDEWVKKCVDCEAEGVNVMLEIVLKELARRASWLHFRQRQFVLC